MALGIYDQPHPDHRLTNDGSYGEPLVSVFDGRIGGAIDKQLFIRNDNIMLWYSSISIVPVDLSNGFYVNGTNGFSWKLIAGDQHPFNENWVAVAHANTLSFTEIIGSSIIGNIGIYLPFWVRVEVPRNESASNIRNVTLRVSALEHLITGS